MRSIAPLTVVLAACAALLPHSAFAATYAVERSANAVVDMYNLSSVSKTQNGFNVTDVITSDHWPKVFGPVSYRVARESYDCSSGTYGIIALADYSADGHRIVRLKSAVDGAMRVVDATASGEMYARFCRIAGAAKVQALAPVNIVEEKTAFSAYQYGRGLLTHPRNQN